jgi:hypothetical protein
MLNRTLYYGPNPSLSLLDCSVRVLPCHTREKTFSAFCYSNSGDGNSSLSVLYNTYFGNFSKHDISMCLTLENLVVSLWILE